ncbi:MAG: hypothetical protein K0U72_13555 [Gammaproteobacteria bacterium]|nr:hypothetical protein [Gammaproteobacteria bacterium]
MNTSRLTIITCIFVLLAGCSSMKPLEADPSQSTAEAIRSSQAIRVGDKVQAVTFDGEIHKGKVTAISDKTLSVDGTAIDLDTIEGVRTRRFSAGKTAALVGGVGAVAYTAIAVSAIVGAIIGTF